MYRLARNPKCIHFAGMTITVKDVPEAIHQDLRKQADAHGRSLNKEIAAILEAAVRPVRTDRRELLQRIEQHRESLPHLVKADELDFIIDEGRS